MDAQGKQKRHLRLGGHQNNNLDELGCPAAVASVAVESRRLKVSLSNARAKKIPSNFALQLPWIPVEGSEHGFVVCSAHLRLAAHASPVANVSYQRDNY